MKDWQPIETAPKGDVLLFWPEIKRERNPLRSMMRVGFAGGTPHRPPTHWMPLPEPPVE